MAIGRNHVQRRKIGHIINTCNTKKTLQEFESVRPQYQQLQYRLTALLS